MSQIMKSLNELKTNEDEELEGKCMAIWSLSGKETEEWNGDSCDCKLIQGTYDCKLNHD